MVAPADWPIWMCRARWAAASHGGEGGFTPERVDDHVEAAAAGGLP